MWQLAANSSGIAGTVLPGTVSVLCPKLSVLDLLGEGDFCFAGTSSSNAGKIEIRGVLLELQGKLPCFCFEFVQSKQHGLFNSFPRASSGMNIPVHTTVLRQTSFSHSANEKAKHVCKNSIGS